MPMQDTDELTEPTFEPCFPPRPPPAIADRERHTGEHRPHQPYAVSDKLRNPYGPPRNGRRARTAVPSGNPAADLAEGDVTAHASDAGQRAPRGAL